MGLATHTDHRADRRSRRRATLAALAVGVVAVVAASCTSSPPEPSLEQFKRTEFGNRALAEAQLIGAGLAPPVLEFTVEGTPPSIFVNYVIPDDRAADFLALIDLPPAFSLAKVRILESDPVAQYWISLNVYRVSGLTTGLRAEWSTYVDDGSGVPRFMIVQARAAEGSVDPLGPLAPPEPFEHTVDADGVIRTEMLRTVDRGLGPVLTADDLFRSTIALPEPADRRFVEPTLEWAAANDFIYWLNGVNDRTFYDAAAHSAPLLSVDLADVTLADDTDWAPFIDPEPAHVLVYLDELRFKISPWWNVTEVDGRVDPATRANLFALKRQMYGGLSTLGALSVLAGTGEPIVRSTIEDTEPSVRWHWQLPDDQLAAFATAAALPPGLTLAPVQLAEGEPAAHWLTLHVYRRSGTDPGLRAEWSTSVDDGTSVRQVILEASSDQRSLDPVNRFAAPSPLQHQVSGTTVSTTVGQGPTAFTSTVELPDPAATTAVLPSRRWVTAGELRYWSNGVGDRVFAGIEPLLPKVDIDVVGVSTSSGGRWAPFTTGGPDRVWVDRGRTDLVTNPWWTLPPN